MADWWKNITFASEIYKLVRLDNMVFENIHISNFRGIRHANVEDLKRINVFFGKNNCGKSSFLEAVFLLTGPSNPILPVRINAFRSYGRFFENDMLLDFYNLDAGNVINISSQGMTPRDLNIAFFVNETGEVQLDSTENGGSNSQERFYGLNLTYKVGEGTEYHSQVSIQKGDLTKGKVGMDSRYQEVIKAQYLPSAYMQSPVNEVYGRLVEKKQEQQIIDILRTIEPKIKDMTLVGQELMVDIGLSQRLPINMMGDGLRKLVAIVLAAYECRDGVLAIDEVDNGFHYSAMKSLWKAIFMASEANNTQVFLTTHNLDFLKGLTEYLSDEVHSEMRNDIAAYKLVCSNDDSLTSLRYDYKTIDYSIDQEIEMR